MKVGHYSRSSITNYLREIRGLLEYYPDKAPADITIDMVAHYLLYCQKTLGAGHAKCHMVAQSASFLFRQILRKDERIPTILYPRKRLVLPPVMSPEEIKQTLDLTPNLKHRTIFSVIYSSGVRVAELCALKITDIDSSAMRIKVVQGKGAKDRFTLLSQQVLEQLRVYYLKYKPTHFLFNGSRSGLPISPRTVQHAFSLALQKAGLEDRDYSVHTLRHSFATHLLDSGTDIHTIKELMGHNSISTTMIYLHLSTARVDRIINPYDRICSSTR